METRDAIKNMDEMIQIKVAEAIADERERHRKTEVELTRTKNQLRVRDLLHLKYYKV